MLKRMRARAEKDRVEEAVIKIQRFFKTVRSKKLFKFIVRNTYKSPILFIERGQKGSGNKDSEVVADCSTQKIHVQKILLEN
jgi:hypothetical protein